MYANIQIKTTGMRAVYAHCVYAVPTARYLPQVF